MNPSYRAQIQILALITILILPPIQTRAASQYFLYPLQSEHVREAYFLARSQDSSKLDAFLNRYIHNFPVSLSGASVQSIEFRTPYELVVQRTMGKQFSYSAQDALRDFAAHRDQVVVRVVFNVTPVATQVTAPVKGVRVTPWPTAEDDQAAERSLDSWYGVQFKVAQKKPIAAKKLATANVTLPQSDDLTLQYAIDLEFDAAQFSAGTATIEVTTPDAKTVRADFDLDKMK